MRRPMWIAPAGVVLIFGIAQPSSGIDEPGEPSSSAPEVRLKLKLTGASTVALQRTEDGSYRYVVTEDLATRELTPNQFAERLYHDHVSRSFLQMLFNITSPIGIAWVALGFLGQVLFTGRMIVQWITSERRGRSVVPVAFWWMSLAGGVMLLTYFLWRKDIVGVVGQSTGVFIYSRNLILITRRGRSAGIARRARHLETSAGSEESDIELQSP